ncbi:hypothetical protein AAHE18_05G033000 [Arachis hypogaea]
MTIVGICRPMRSPWDQPMDRCLRFFPCLIDPARRSAMCVKLVLVTVHLVYIGVLFLIDGDLIEKTKKEPVYVLDAMMTLTERNVLYRKTSEASSLPASGKNGSFVVAVEGSQAGKNISGNNTPTWSKLVADLYPMGTTIRTWTCSYCNVEQPPRSKHCHDCDKCVLQFDHHCVWLGNCIGQDNHCRFWWYLCEETALCLWTGILYISYLKDHIKSSCYLILTNQTTYELVRRRRIPYLRGIPERVHPFSKGVSRNVYNFCCGSSSVYNMERLPTPQETEEKSRPYTCLDVVTCRCC